MTGRLAGRGEYKRTLPGVVRPGAERGFVAALTRDLT